MDAEPSAKPRRKLPPVPPNYVSLRLLQELRLKEKEEEEKRKGEEEEAAAKRVLEAEAAAAKRVLEAEAAAAAKRVPEAAAAKRVPETAAAKRVPEAEARWRAESSKASGGAKEGHRGQGQGHRWVAVPLAPPPRGEVAAAKKDGKGKASASTSGEPVGGPDKSTGSAGALSRGGLPENTGNRKAEPKEKPSGDQSAESGSSGGPAEPPAEAASASSQGHATPGRKHRGNKGGGVRSAGTSSGGAVGKSAGASQTGKPKPKPKPSGSGIRRAASSASSVAEEKVAPAKAPPAEGSGNRAGPRTDTEAKSDVPAEGHRRRSAVEVRAAAELKPPAARRAAWPRANVSTGVWIPKSSAVSPADCAGL